MRHLEVMRTLSPDDVAAVASLLEVAERADGHRPLDEHRWLDMAQGGRHSFAGLVAWEPGHDHPVGYAQVSRGSGSWALDLVVDPHHRYDAGAIGPELLEGALGLVRGEGGGHVHLWVHQPTAGHDAIAEAVGLHRGRDLLQLRLELPVEHEPLDLAVRAFRPGADEEAWLEVNNRAFAWHPEQGGWDLDALCEREAESWFDPEGFLLHERDGRLAGFCWTKVHADHDPPLGEIYVIAVDPDFVGHGLGRSLVLAGLDSLSERGLRTAMLYVDAANAPACGLYDALGFTLDHVDRAYVGDVAADGATAQVTVTPRADPTA
ncbi:MAG: mycothiol synthase [Acidimicrobiia bacterium]|nr:mycothiol synthase [Acidimicrobiia bacterium]